MKFYLPKPVIITIIVAFLGVIGGTIKYVDMLYERNTNLNSSLSLCYSDKATVILEKETLESDNKKLGDLISQCSLGTKDWPTLISSEDFFESFMRDWDSNESFYNPTGTRLFCPRTAGNNNYQRISYNDYLQLPAKGLRLEMNIKMYDQDLSSQVEYQQRFVIGIADRNKYLSEYDIPTRYAETVNFNEASPSGSFAAFQESQEIQTPIRDKSPISLVYEITPGSNQRLRQNLHINFFSEVEKYGKQSKDLSYDHEVENLDVENMPVRPYIGSYIHGCFEVESWKLTPIE